MREHPGTEEQESAHPVENRVGRRVIAQVHLEHQAGYAEQDPERGRPVHHRGSRHRRESTPRTRPGSTDRRTRRAHTVRLPSRCATVNEPEVAPLINGHTTTSELHTGRATLALSRTTGAANGVSSRSAHSCLQRARNAHPTP